MQMLEEEVLDTHKMVMDQTTRFLNDAHSVFSVTHEVDYDQEGKTVKPHLPIDDSKPYCILYRTYHLDIESCSLARVFCTHHVHACTYASTRNESVYIYISSLLPSRSDVASGLYIYIYASLSYVIVPLYYSFVSFPKRFKHFFLFIYSPPPPRFEFLSFSFSHNWGLPLFDDTVENACLDVDLMGAATTTTATVTTTTTTTTTSFYFPVHIGN